MRNVIDVPYLDQSVRYPTGCESVSAVMLLRYLGYEMSVDEFIEQYLDRQEFELREGELYGPDPTKYFCGSPYAIGEMYEVLDLTGTEIKTLQTEYIDKGMPVILWACINMREPITGPQWKLKDSGEVFTWISNEHCMLLVGYDEEGYYFNDPYENNGVIRYPKEIVEDRYKAQHMQAVAVKKK